MKRRMTGRVVRVARARVTKRRRVVKSRRKTARKIVKARRTKRKALARR